MEIRRVIIIDTHIWFWWVQAHPKLPSFMRVLPGAVEQTGIGVSAISCWEIAKLVECQRLSLPSPVQDWMRQALAYPGIRLLDLSTSVCVESTQLPGAFHRDPADQIIVATARFFDAPLLTVDAKILAYPHVRLARAA